MSDERRYDEDERPFIVKSEAAIHALPRWLRKRKFNSYIQTSDRKGNVMFGLSWDRKPDSDWSRDWEKRGLILILNPDFKEAAEEQIRKAGGWAQ